MSSAGASGRLSGELRRCGFVLPSPAARGAGAALGREGGTAGHRGGAGCGRHQRQP